MNQDVMPNQPPHPIDVEVGARLRDARRTQAVSQESLGHRLNLTAHEVQRLENGLDRLSASMLVRAAEAIGVRPAALLPESPQTSCLPATITCAPEAEPSHEADLLTAFHRIGSPHLRSTVVNMARQLADETELEASECILDGDEARSPVQSRDLGGDAA